MPQTWADLGIEIPAHATGQEVYTTCPKCSHERKKKRAKCLSANIGKGAFVCHHCGWAGSLKGGRSMHYEPAWHKPQWVRPDPKASGALPAHVVQWFAARGIPVAVLERNHIGWTRVYMPQLEEHADAIVFPYLRSGELINRKYRTLAKQFRMDTGAERILYGLDDIGETVVICEGELDKLSVEVAGIASCVSVPDGAPAVGTKDCSAKFTFLDSAKKELARVKKYILGVDNDAPGLVLEDELARRLGRERCWRVKWPAGCKDANDVLVKHGATDLRWLLEHAEPYPVEAVVDGENATSRSPVLVQMSTVAPETVDWLWEPYIPRSKLTLLEGNPGVGKTWLALTFAAIVSRGWGWPDAADGVPRGSAEAANVVYLTAEDGLADTLRPRLDTAGADCGRVFCLTATREGDSEIPVTLRDVDMLDATLTKTHAVLLVVDPLQAYLGSGVDMHRANETRPVLAGLARLAEVHKCAVLCVRHLRKSSADHAMYRGLGSIDFTAAARSVLLVGRDPGDGIRRALIHIKSNLAAEGASLGYVIEDNVVRWTGSTDLTVAAVLAAEADDGEGTALDEAKAFLLDLLADGSVPSSDVQKQARQAGVSERTLHRAKAGLRIRSIKTPTGWVWTLKVANIAREIGGNVGNVDAEEGLIA